jgi:hypothetical protein
MASAAQRRAAKRNIRKAQAAWRGMSPRAHARRQPSGRGRAKPGDPRRRSVLSRRGPAAARVPDLPHAGHRQEGRHRACRRQALERVLGHAEISKEHAHRVRRRLVPDTADARKVLKILGAPPRHVGGDRFKAKDRPDVPERKKPTPAMRRARTRNILKAQAARGRQR